MSYASVYNKCVTMFMEDIQEIVEQTHQSVDVAFAVVKLRNDQINRHEEEMLVAHQQMDQQKAEVKAAAVPLIKTALANGTRPYPRDILQQTGYPPTKVFIGVVNWQIRQLTHHPMPAE